MEQPAGRSAELATARWPDVPHRALVLLPIGSTEQHGPHLPLDTDTVIAEAVSRAAAARLAAGEHPVLVAPSLGYGASGEHQAFPGTMSIGTPALHAVIVELARSLRTWAPRLVVVTGHGGNMSALMSAIRQLRDEGHDAAWTSCGSGGWDAHAGHAETSIMLHLAPDRVGPDRPAGRTEPVAELMPQLASDGVRAVSANGVLGDASGASAADGERMFRAAVDLVVRRIDHGRADRHGRLLDPAPAPAEP